MRKLFLTALLLCATFCFADDLLLKNLTIYDGYEKPPAHGDVRITGDRITAVAPQLKPEAGETVIDEHGLAISPGFIDMHSHADRYIFADLAAESAVRQGITTVVVGHDGDSIYPLADFLSKLDAHSATINVASMAGHGTMREQVMGKDLLRPATPSEVAKMTVLLAQEMKAGAFGLSSGLEYDAGHASTTEEVVDLSRVAAEYDGFYISHVRDEGNHVFDSFDEILRIGREASLPVEITHIKLGTTPVWHLAATRMPEYWATAEREGVNLKADVYPYTFWAATIRVIVLDRDFTNPGKVAKAIADNGGPEAIRFAHYDPDPSIVDLTLEQVSAKWKMTPVEAYMKVVRETLPDTHPGNTPEESVMVTSMSEDDLRYFIADPHVMYCTDGELQGKHPRGAGAFPRILGKYVREEKLLSLELAIHKMTLKPASRLGLTDRGQIAAGKIADLVLFDPATVIDGSTVQDPLAPPKGIKAVMVGGQWVVQDNVVTAARPGKALRHAQTAKITKVASVEASAPLAMTVGGRVLVENDPADQLFGAKKYTYQWPGTYFTASFRGTEAYFRVGEGNQILHVVVDQQPPVVLVKPEPGAYRVSGLTDGVHTVRIEVVTESQAGPNSFGGFSLPPSSSPLPAPHKARQIEFIGDSHTVGYGNTSTKHECTEDEVWETTDNSLAYGPLTAIHYAADYQINAISGRGIVRNYDGSTGDPLPVAYPYVLFDKHDLYAGSSWNPQIVVLALGTNDFSTPLNPGEKWKSRDQLHADYEATYLAFLKKLRTRYPHASFILWATDGADGEIQAEAQKVTRQLQADGDTRVALIPVNGLAMSACHWHPSIEDDELVAAKLIDFIDLHPQLWQPR